MRNIFLLAACVCIAALANSADAALLANWKFDETDGIIASDSAGSNDGVLSDNEGLGNLPIWRPSSGRFGGALRFQSNQQDIVTVPDFNYGDTGNFTTSIWTKADTATPKPGSDWQYFWSTGNFAETGGFNYYLINETDTGGTARPADEAGSYRVRAHDDNGNGNSGNTTFPGTAQSDVWRMMTVTYSTTDGAKFYVDGVLEATDPTLNGPMGSSGKDMFFGARADINLSRFYGTIEDFVDAPDSGLLDDAAIWDVTLTRGQILDVFRNGATDNPVPEPATFVMLLMGAACSAVLRRHRIA